MSQSGATETIRRAGTPPNAACLQQSAHDSPGRENREPQPIIRIYSGREITKIPEKNVFFQTIIHLTFFPKYYTIHLFLQQDFLALFLV